MPTTRRMWPSAVLDGVSIALPSGDVVIEGSDGEQVEVEGEQASRLPHLDWVEQVERWLLIHPSSWDDGKIPLTLHLPKGKAWIVELSTARGDVQVNSVQARLQIMTGQGDIQVSECRGVFSLASGAGDIQVENCRQADMPEPRSVQPGAQGSTAPSDEGGGPAAAMSEQWLPSAAAKGLAKARLALESALARLPAGNGSAGGREAAGGGEALSAESGSGDVELENVHVETCRVRLGQGDVTLRGGRIARLHVRVGRGDIECEGAVAAGEWDVETASGDVSLAMPGNAPARLDVATRHGEIRSDIPLVRVARPGPETRYGARMVGTVGRAGADASPVGVRVTRGDIKIEIAEDAPWLGSQETAGAAAGAGGPDGARTTQAAAGQSGPQEPGYESEMAVLQALRAREIRPEEAEQLLRSMGA